MTQAEQASLDRLSDKVDAGFLEMRQLMESRRLEEVRVQAALDARLRKVERIAYSAGVIGTAGLSFAVFLANHYIA